jgi:hypothetical protein
MEDQARGARRIYPEKFLDRKVVEGKLLEERERDQSSISTAIRS